MIFWLLDKSLLLLKACYLSKATQNTVLIIAVFLPYYDEKSIYFFIGKLAFRNH